MFRTLHLFGADWPRYAVGAHLAFWLASLVLLCGCMAAYAGFASVGTAILLFVLWLAAAAILGLAGLCSGKLYYGNIAFGFNLLTGWSARIMGGFVFFGATLILLLGYGLTQVHG